jgi:hypothetical protein
VIFPKIPTIIAMNLNTTEDNKTSLGNVESCIVVLVELFAIVILFLNLMTNMLSCFKVLQNNIPGDVCCERRRK